MQRNCGTERICKLALWIMTVLMDEDQHHPARDCSPSGPVQRCRGGFKLSKTGKIHAGPRLRYTAAGTAQQTSFNSVACAGLEALVLFTSEPLALSRKSKRTLVHASMPLLTTVSCPHLARCFSASVQAVRTFSEWQRVVRPLSENDSIPVSGNAWSAL